MEEKTPQTNNMPLISVIVPVYKTEAYLRKCVDSILGQTYPNLEIVLVDDGSPDGCPAICDEYAAKDSRIKAIHKPNGGVSSARNLGLDLAAGEYIGFVDSDDWIEPEMYEQLLLLIWKSNADISVCGFCFDSEEKPGIPDKRDLSVCVFTPIEARVEMHRGKHFEGHLWTKLFSSRTFQNVRFPDGINICEDMVACGAAFANCQAVAYSPCEYYHYLTRESSAVHIFHDADWSVLKACDLLYQQMLNASPENARFADCTCVEHSLILALRCRSGKKLNRKNFQRIRNYMNEHMTRQSLQLTGRKNRVYLFAIRLGRIPFLILCWLKHSLYHS